MIGFLTGVAVNIVCGQVADLTGAQAKARSRWPRRSTSDPSGRHRAGITAHRAGRAGDPGRAGAHPAGRGQCADRAGHPDHGRRAGGADSVARVGDEGDIPPASRCRTCPTSGCSRSAWSRARWRWRRSCSSRAPGWPRPRPTRTAPQSDTNRDIIAQGAGNLASGLFRGLPVGGSVGQTALNVSAGARTRWAAICSGVWMLVILVAVLRPGRQGRHADPGRGAHLRRRRLAAGGEIRTIMRTGRTSQIAVTTTFLATLFLPVAAAVGMGWRSRCCCS